LVLQGVNNGGVNPHVNREGVSTRETHLSNVVGFRENKHDVDESSEGFQQFGLYTWIVGCVVEVENLEILQEIKILMRYKAHRRDIGFRGEEGTYMT